MIACPDIQIRSFEEKIYKITQDLLHTINFSAAHIKSLGFKNARVNDCFRRDWYWAIERNSVLEEYKRLKKNYVREIILDLESHDFLLQDYKLSIQSERFGRNGIH